MDFGIELVIFYAVYYAVGFGVTASPIGRAARSGFDPMANRWKRAAQSSLLVIFWPLLIAVPVFLWGFSLFSRVYRRTRYLRRPLG